MKIRNYTLNKRQEEMITNFIGLYKANMNNKDGLIWKSAYIDYCTGIQDTVNDSKIVDMQDFMEYLRYIEHGEVGD